MLKRNSSLKILTVLKSSITDMLVDEDGYRHDPKCSPKLLLDTHIDVILRQRSEEGKSTLTYDIKTVIVFYYA